MMKTQTQQEMHVEQLVTALMKLSKEDNQAVVVNVRSAINIPIVIESFTAVANDYNIYFGNSEWEDWQFKISKESIFNIKVDLDSNIIKFHIIDNCADMGIDFTF